MTETTEATEATQIVFGSRDKNNFLSNYYIEPDGTCVQWEFQRAKARTAKDIAKFDTAEARTPGRAKSLGHSIQLPEGWATERVSIMENLVAKKFSDHPELARALKATGSAQLIKRSSCSSSGWGMSASGEGENMLGKILMKIRDGL